MHVFGTMLLWLGALPTSSIGAENITLWLPLGVNGGAMEDFQFRLPRAASEGSEADAAAVAAEWCTEMQATATDVGACAATLAAELSRVRGVEIALRTAEAHSRWPRSFFEVRDALDYGGMAQWTAPGLQTNLARNVLDVLGSLLPSVGTPRVARILEIGSFKGSNAVALLHLFPSAHITCVDAWEPMLDGVAYPGMAAVEHTFDDQVRRLVPDYASRVTKIRARSAAALGALLDAPTGGRFDLVYVDGAHDLMPVLVDAVLAWRLLRPGGAALAIFDDYEWLADDPDPLRRAGPALDFFRREYAAEIDRCVAIPRGQLLCRRLFADSSRGDDLAFGTEVDVDGDGDGDPSG